MKPETKKNKFELRWILPLLTFTAGFTSCTKQQYKQKAYTGPEEALVSQYITANPDVIINQDHAVDIPYEYGIVFTSAKKGYVSALGIQMPVAGSAYTVSFWEVETATLLKRVDITNSLNSAFNYINLEAAGQSVPLLSNKKYMVSVFVKAAGQAQPWSYYYLLKPSGSGAAANYIPFTSGSLTCTGAQFTLTSSPAFPDQPVLHADILDGLCDLKFRATEK